MNKKTIKAVVTIAIVAVLCFGFSAAALAKNYSSYKTGKVVSAELNVRSSASTSASVRTTLKSGTKITLKGYKNSEGIKWYKITYNGKTGYVAADYVKIVSKLSYNIYSPVKYGKTTGELNVRTKPSTSASVMTTVSSGHKMKLKGYKGSWYAVTYKGKTGFVSADYVKKISKSAYNGKSTSSKNNASSAKVKAYGKTLSELNVRSKASTDGEVLVTLKSGFCFKIFGSKTNSKGEKWYKVMRSGKIAYVYSGSVTKISKAAYEKARGGSSNSSSSGSVKAYGKAKDGVNVRSKASTSGKILTVLEEGHGIKIYGTKTNSEGEKWYKVRWNGKTSYVIASAVKKLTKSEYQALKGNTSTSTSKKYGLTTTGVNVRKKASTSAKVLAAVNKNFAFVIKGSKTNGGRKWYKLSYGGSTGYICADYVKKVSKKTFNKYNTATQTVSKKYGKVTEGVNVRKTAKKNGVLLGSLSKGHVFRIYASKTDGSGNNWYRIKYNGSYAYVIASCVKQISYKEYKKYNGTDDNTGNPGGGSGSSVVSFALSLQGCPYVYGAAGPSSFDCSGFTMYVLGKFGVALPHYDGDQMRYGKSVGYANAQPGDLVFYGGHVGIYIGNGQIVHASSSYGKVKTESATYRTIIDVRRYL